MRGSVRAWGILKSSQINLENMQHMGNSERERHRWETPCGKIPDSTINDIRNDCQSLECTALDLFAGCGKATLELGDLVRRSDAEPWRGNYCVEKRDALEAIRFPGTNRILILMFPPPDSDVPYRVLKAARKNGFEVVYIMQERLEADHCGDQEYVDLAVRLGATQLDDYERPIVREGFYTRVWKIVLEAQTDAELADEYESEYKYLVNFPISELIDGIPQVTNAMSAEYCGLHDIVEATTPADWKRVVTIATQDLAPENKFLFVCAVAYYSGYMPATRKTFDVVSKENYKLFAIELRVGCVTL